MAQSGKAKGGADSRRKGRQVSDWLTPAARDNPGGEERRGEERRGEERRGEARRGALGAKSEWASRSGAQMRQLKRSKRRGTRIGKHPVLVSKPGTVPPLADTEPSLMLLAP